MQHADPSSAISRDAAPTAARPGPLSDLTVLDFSRLAPGPMAAAMLGDLGASVIKVEEPGGGRRAREERRLRGEPEGQYSESELHRRKSNPFERGKRSIAIDLKNPEGHLLALRLGTMADIVIEGFRPGVMQRLGLGYEHFRDINPRVVYCSLTGYGQYGPRCYRVGHDLNYLADTGALSLFATRGSSRPIVPPNLLADFAGGSLQAVIGILSAVHARQMTGRGQFVDVSLSDGVLALLAAEASSYATTGEVPLGGNTRLTGGMAYYDVYETSDGRFISLACNEPAFFRELCAELGLEHLIEGQQNGDVEWQDRAREAIQARIRGEALRSWEQRFSRRDIAFAPVRTLDEVLSDAHYIERGVVHPEGGGLSQSARIGTPFHLSETPAVAGFEVPLPGQHTTELLRDLGCSQAQIEALRTAGAIA